jgi:GTP-binding protein HflX
MTKTTYSTQEKTERAVLVGVEAANRRDSWSLESSLDELNQLARTAGADVVGKLTQKLERPSSTHYIGSGKMQELIELKQELNYDTVVINDDLAPRQWGLNSTRYPRPIT